MRIEKTFKLQFLAPIIFFISLSSCKQKYEVESQAIDSLIAKNHQAREYLQIDLKTIHSRTLEMKEQIELMNRNGIDSSNETLMLNFEKYKGIYKIYTNFINNYDHIFDKVRHIDKQLAALKNSLQDDKINAKEYKMAMEKETENVNMNLADSKVFGLKIFNLEPDYQRLSNFFVNESQRILEKQAQQRSN
ncbi:MAG: hypothetical protein H6605_03060 [Flavobacteriales bacterium]|nr:hypothetical protein [Flavobacteriales bacterium]